MTPAGSMAHWLVFIPLKMPGKIPLFLA